MLQYDKFSNFDRGFMGDASFTIIKHILKFNLISFFDYMIGGH